MFEKLTQIMPFILTILVMAATIYEIISISIQIRAYNKKLENFQKTVHDLTEDSLECLEFCRNLLHEIESEQCNVNQYMETISKMQKLQDSFLQESRRLCSLYQEAFSLMQQRLDLSDNLALSDQSEDHPKP